MEAILLVGGQGTRLRPLTVTVPKPMLAMAGVPFLTHQLARLKEAGVDHVVMATSYKSEVFEGHFGDGSAFGLDLEYCYESEPMGTGGGIRNVSSHLRSGPNDPVLVFNGDVLTGVDLNALVQHHTDTEAYVTIYLTRVPDPRAYGLVTTEPDGRVVAFLEKPEKHEQIVTNQINAGCYVFRRSVVDSIPGGRPISVERETFPEILATGQRVSSMTADCYWLDMGTPSAFVRGACDLVTGRAPSPAVTTPGAFLALPGSDVSPHATLTAGTCVGAGATVEAGASVDGSVLMEGATVEANARIVNSVVGRDARIGAGVVLHGAIVGDGAVVGAGCELLNGARVFPGVVLPAYSVRFSSDR